MKKSNKHKLLVLIEEIIRNNNHRSQIKQVFDDIIQLTLNCVLSPEFMDEAAPGCYLKVKPYLVNELSDYKYYPKAWELLQDASLEIMSMVKNSEPFTDILGELYDKQLGKVLGQFLTPKQVAYGINKFIMADSQPFTEKTIVGDFCGCGAGSLILNHLKTIYEMHGAESLKHVDVIGMDIDAKMVQLTALQVILHSCIHNLPINQLSMFHGHAIIDYIPENGKDTLAIHWAPNFYKDIDDKLIDMVNELDKELSNAY